jgi:tetratricopeptide (TPR) repeat protein
MIFRDPRLRLTVGVTLLIALALLLILPQLDEDIQFPVVVAVAVGTGILQMVLIFWRSPRRTSLLEAQRAFINGDYRRAAQLLELHLKIVDQQDKTPDVKALTLLGNTYRQLGRLNESENTLRQALTIAPEHNFPLYGLGRTLLARGEYSHAAEYIEQSLEKGGRKAIRTELALALYYAEADEATIVQICKKALRVLNIEKHRALMAGYLLYNLYQNQPDIEEHERLFAQRIMHNSTDGLAFWRGEASRHAHTDFGKRLTRDIQALKSLLKEQVPDAAR